MLEHSPQDLAALSYCLCYKRKRQLIIDVPTNSH